MRTIELIQCRIKKSPPPILFDPPKDNDAAQVRVTLTHGSRVLHTASNYRPAIMQDERDTELVYLITVWPDVETHTAYTKSPARQELIDQVKECMSLEWLSLYDVKSAHGLPVKAPVFGIGRFNIAEEDSAEFDKRHQDVKRELEKYSGHTVICGWKVKDYIVNEAGDFVENNADERKEFATFTGFESVEKRYDFSHSESYLRYASIREYVKWFERRNARVIDLK